jgi:glycerol uptake operon antiterminator
MLVIEKRFAKPVIPVVAEIPDCDAFCKASTVFIQGATLKSIPKILRSFEAPELKDIGVFVHVDLLSGVKATDAAVEYLADYNRINGIVSINSQLMKPAKRLGLQSILRVFLQDTRSLNRGLAIAQKSKPDAIEFLPAFASVEAADLFHDLKVPQLAGGLVRTEDDVRKIIGKGFKAVTSTNPDLWKLNVDP